MGPRFSRRRGEWGASLMAANHRRNGRPARLETEPRSNASAAHGRDARAPWKIPAIAIFGEAARGMKIPTNRLQAPSPILYYFF
jgi:hypothetical protein